MFHCLGQSEAGGTHGGHDFCPTVPPGLEDTVTFECEAFGDAYSALGHS